ncbi:MAG: restriction endonuclease subunit S [Chloroflexota bacterium]|nr:restriction endonuclease subunit S [Chloroflexota bacterium]MDE2959808.1 restriction endonuclease subunit S [Chloroflexota bacterium]
MLYEAGGLRLDAGYYNAETIQAHRAMAASGLTMMRLGDVTERIFIPPRFKRVYVDEAHGVPFLQGTHIVHFRPADLKYLSRSAHRNLERWIIKAGWVLVTCSGTIGRVAIALQQWDDWAASQHILRVVPKADGICPAGYIYAWLSSPLGQAQFNGIYGAVVDELTADHVKNILIPVPETEEQRDMVRSINALVMDAVATKERALEQDALAVETVSRLIPAAAG